MNKFKVMVVDDSDLILSQTRDALEEAGFDIVTRNRPIGTTAAIKNEEPDCVLIDVNMPALSGGEIVKLVRKVMIKNLKIIFHSSKEENELIQLVNECGADGYVKKGADKSELVNKIKSVLKVNSH